MHSSSGSRPDPRAILAAIVATIALIGAVALSAWRVLYSGFPNAVPVTTLGAVCEGGVDPQKCEAVVTRIDQGRFHIQTSTPANAVAVTIGEPAAVKKSRTLLIRGQTPGHLIVERASGGERTELLRSELPAQIRRQFVDLQGAGTSWNRITFVPSAPRGLIAIDELGFFDDSEAVRQPLRPLFSQVPAGLFHVLLALTLFLCAFLVGAARYVPEAARLRIGPWAIGGLTMSICVLELAVTFSPYWSGDLRSRYVAEVLHSGATGNLTGGLFEGTRLVQGLGQTVATGLVQWHRMPGYGLLCGLAAALTQTRDVVDLAMVMIAVQAVLFSAGVGVFVAAAQGVFQPWMAWLLGVTLALLPKQIADTQVDAVVPSIALVVLAALLVHLADERKRGRATFRAFLFVNGACALWFLMRNDVLPGWIALSFALAPRRWRALVVPALLIVMIALPWALYKQRYRGTFDPMPTNTGEVLFLGLCEVPGAFPRECSDAGYLSWARQISGTDPTSNAASNRAIGEVLRHWITYPVHFLFMIAFKVRRAVFDFSWPGFQTPFNKPVSVLRQAGGFVWLLAVVALAVATGHERRRSLLLAWPLVLNMPMFFVAFSSGGRFYGPAGISALVAAVPLLFERGFYSSIARHSGRAALVIAGVAAISVLAPRFERWVATHDAVHYWTPWLDPGASTIRFPAPGIGEFPRSSPPSPDQW